LYKRDCFILEAKQSRLKGPKRVVPEGQADLFSGSKPQHPHTDAIDHLMISARRQAEGYAQALPKDHPYRAIIRAQKSDHEMLHLREDGEPWTYAGFKTAWQREMNLPKFARFREERVVYRGTRKNAVNNLLEVGCSEALVGAIAKMSPAMVHLQQEGQPVPLGARRHGAIRSWLGKAPAVRSWKSQDRRKGISRTLIASFACEHGEARFDWAGRTNLASTQCWSYEANLAGRAGWTRNANCVGVSAWVAFMSAGQCDR
jgi:hypothetical protein